MCNRTNNFIVTHVKNNYNLPKLIRKMIDTSIPTKTYGDLEQYIYEVLLNMDNYKLNELYHKKNELRKFISQIIKNQRNNGKYFHSLILNEKRIESLQDYDTPDVDEHNYCLDFIMDRVEGIDFFLTGQTQVQLRKDMAITVLCLYILKGVPKWKLCLDYRCGISTLNLLIKDGKKYLKEDYDNNFDSFVQFALGNIDK